jgi:SAM-dependent methyltransferase
MQQTFIQHFKESITKGTFVKMTLSKNVGSDRALRNIYIRLVELKNVQKLSFLYRNATNDITKNEALEDAFELLNTLLGASFLNAELMTSERDFSLMYNKKREPKLTSKKAVSAAPSTLSHDKEKKKWISASAPYLAEMEISSRQGDLLKDGQKKFRQINKYIETIDSLLREQPLKPDAHIVDMGCGKGYLTFALYDYLRHELKLNVSMTGIELRQNLVEFCNTLSQKIDYQQLTFVNQDIFDYQPKRLDMLIALHACDIATDIAIAKGIKAKADWIVVAPCCHKQIRKAMQPPSAELKALLGHGILAERQAELLTDSLRSLILEAHGYATKVFEFISTEHTPKNVMIVGRRTGKPKLEALKHIEALKLQFGISEHYLETLL